jgi:hypothetical protein
MGVLGLIFCIGDFVTNAYGGEISVFTMESKDKSKGTIYSIFTLRVAKNALANPIEAKGLAAPATRLDQFIGGFYAFEKDVEFLREATIRITYTEEAVKLYRKIHPDFQESNLSIATIGMLKGKRNILPSTFDRKTRTLTAKISRISRDFKECIAIVEKR